MYGFVLCLQQCGKDTTNLQPRLTKRWRQHRRSGFQARFLQAFYDLMISDINSRRVNNKPLVDSSAHEQIPEGVALLRRSQSPALPNEIHAPLSVANAGDPSLAHHCVLL